MKQLLLLAICTVLFTTAVSGQEASAPALMRLPKSVNPKDGYSSGGTVNIRVGVDVNGNVTDAKFLSGPGAVCSRIARPDIVKTREAALALARQAKFTPAMRAEFQLHPRRYFPLNFQRRQSRRPCLPGKPAVLVSLEIAQLNQQRKQFQNRFLPMRRHCQDPLTPLPREPSGFSARSGYKS